MRRILAAFVLAFVLLNCTPAVTRAHSTRTVTYTQGDPNITVWANTNSGVYHCPGTKWYGKTKQGKYMLQKAAQDAGHRPAYGNACG